MADERNNEIEETKIQGVNGPITGWLDGHTILVGLMAYPIRHTMSPTMHNNAFAKLGLNGAYLCFEIDSEKLPGAIDAIRTLDMRGSNVSMPNKKKVIPYLDKLDKTSQMCDAVDIELFHDEERVKDLVKQAHNYNVVVIMSNHDFEKVPAKDVIEFRLKKMADLGADVPKLACMPHSADDVLTLLSATNDAHKALANPIITMAMADLGKVSRIAGQVFGSCLSFGAVGKTSAPGQLSIEDLRNAENYLELH